MYMRFVSFAESFHQGKYDRSGTYRYSIAKLGGSKLQDIWVWFSIRGVARQLCGLKDELKL